MRRSLRDIFAELEQDYPHLKENILSAMGNLDPNTAARSRVFWIRKATGTAAPNFFRLLQNCDNRRNAAFDFHCVIRLRLGSLVYTDFMRLLPREEKFFHPVQ